MAWIIHRNRNSQNKSLEDSSKRSVTEEQELGDEAGEHDYYEDEMWMNLVPIKIKEIIIKGIARKIINDHFSCSSSMWLRLLG